MENQPYLSVIIPAYNEEKRISKTLLAVDEYLQKQSFEYEILVVSDGSTDKTAQIITDFQKSIKSLKLVDNKANHGKGWVTRQGMLAALGQVRLFMDADNATTLDHFDKMKPYFEQGANVVIGSRDSKDAKGAKQAVSQPGLKRLLGNAGNILIQIFAVWGVWDTQCGFKAFSAQAAKDIFSKSKIDRWGFDIEALALARKLKYKIDIVPVYWINDPNSKVSMKGYLMTFKELFQVWWWLVTDAYKLRIKK
ncbi:MAG: glycosyltransferase family 2 protein [Candidatus Portnoybacteria bacterium]|nr:glycosyltransferase family 2 protein [Candidatus Portnoybacteria bacterium]MDD4982563.1 glycosyltransferase family 2 protein [Candidatus Portnoybacteria bacterium]